MKNKKLIVVIVIIVLGIGLFVYNQNKSPIKMLNYTVEEIVSHLPNRTLVGMDYVKDEQFDITLNDLKPLSTMVFEEVELPQNAKQVLSISEGGLSLSVYQNEDTYYLATNSYKVVSNKNEIYTPLFHEHVYQCDKLVDWFKNLQSTIEY